MVSQQQHSTYTKISTQSRKMNKISNNIHIYYILYFFIYIYKNNQSNKHKPTHPTQADKLAFIRQGTEGIRSNSSIISQS